MNPALTSCFSGNYVNTWNKIVHFKAVITVWITPALLHYTSIKPAYVMLMRQVQFIIHLQNKCCVFMHHLPSIRMQCDHDSSEILRKSYIWGFMQRSKRCVDDYFASLGRPWLHSAEEKSRQKVITFWFNLCLWMCRLMNHAQQRQRCLLRKHLGSVS